MSALEARDDVKSFIGQNSPILDEDFFEAGRKYFGAKDTLANRQSSLKEAAEDLNLSWCHFVAPSSTDGSGEPINSFMSETQWKDMQKQVADNILSAGKSKLSKLEAEYWDADSKVFAKFKKTMTAAKAKAAQEARTEGARKVSRKMGDFAKLLRAKEDRGGATGVRPLQVRLHSKASTSLGAINKNEKLEDSETFPKLKEAKELFEELCELLK
jgi:hypothetical protein